jgi:hypothetical protein
MAGRVCAVGKSFYALLAPPLEDLELFLHRGLELILLVLLRAFYLCLKSHGITSS